MSQGEPRYLGVDVRPHVFDPLHHPDLFDGVLIRRMQAFVIDAMVIAAPVIFAAFAILLFGLVTFGLGWAMFWFLGPGATVWAVLYYGFTLGGPASATLGQRVMGLEMRLWHGAPCYFLLGAVHAVLYWVSVVALTPLVLVIGPFNSRKRLLHDLLLGTVVVDRTAAHAVLHGALR